MLIFLVWLTLPALPGYAQVDTTGVRTDTVEAAAQDTARQVAFKVVPWDFRPSLDMDLAASDSTLRWQIWPGWTYKKNRDPGVITYRLGTALRSNAMLAGAHEPAHQELSWEGRVMNDPVSGTVPWFMIPLHNVSALYEEDGGIRHETDFYLKEYYLNKPLTRLAYDESKFNFRNLNFMISQNFTQKWNAELGYFDQRAGGEYSNSEVEGRQIFGRLYYLPDHRQMLKLQFLNNHYDMREPFGYAQAANFNRFDAIALQSSGRTDFSANTLALNYYRRPADSAATRNTFHASLYTHTRKRNTSYSADTTAYSVRTAGGMVRKWWNLPGIQVEGAGTAELYSNRGSEASSLARDRWQLYKAEGKLELEPFSFFRVNGGAEYRYRSDGFSATEMRGEVEVPVTGRLDFTVDASYGSIMPTPQQLYWQSGEYAGNPGLANERIQSAGGKLRVNVFGGLDIGVKGRLKTVDNPVRMGIDSTFGNANRYQAMSGTAFFEFNHPHLELSGSATIHRYENKEPAAGGINAVPEGDIIWMKGGAYWKGYVFDRAAYVKAGVSGMFSPYRYRAGRYFPSMDYWQPGSTEPLIPSFNHLDVDISARVRTIMIVLRWENVLDDVAQLGYFETARYPMSQRRFIFGIRALFRN